MVTSSLRLICSLLLVFVTTAPIWSSLLTDQGDSIEVFLETESDKELEEREKGKDSDYDFLSLEGSIPAFSLPPVTLKLTFAFLKVGSATYAPVSENRLGLYLLYHALKIAC